MWIAERERRRDMSSALASQPSNLEVVRASSLNKDASVRLLEAKGLILEIKSNFDSLPLCQRLVTKMCEHLFAIKKSKCVKIPQSWDKKRDQRSGSDLKTVHTFEDEMPLPCVKLT